MRRALWLLICAAVGVGGADVATTTTSLPPHIVFLMCDEMDGRVLDPASPLYGLQHMPNLRALAARGVQFARAYANSPQCVPSRSSMLSGRRASQTRA